MEFAGYSWVLLPMGLPHLGGQNRGADDCRIDACALPQALNNKLNSASIPPIKKFKRRFENGTGNAPIMTRPSDITRERILKAAQQLFADGGYDGTNNQGLVSKASVNQAAINCLFEGKDGLYREVLRAAFRAMTEDQVTHG